MGSVFDVANGISIRHIITDYTGVNVLDAKGNISCPFHDDDNPSFHIYDNTNTFYCFSCGVSGTPVNFVSFYKGIEPKGAAEDIASAYNLPYTEAKVDPEYKQYIEVYAHAAELFNMLNRHREAVQHDFWKRRGLDEIADEYKLGYCLDHFVHKKTRKVMTFKEIILEKFPNIKPEVLDTYGLYDKYGKCIFSNRFVFPIHDKHGRIIAFSGRSVDGYHPKYINTAENDFFKKRGVLYNWHEAKKYGTVIVVEGYTDALSLIAQGIKNVVAVMGTSFTKEHLDALKDKEIVLALDNDLPGRAKMVDIIEKYPNRIFKVYELKDCKDFNEAHMCGEDITFSIAKETVYGAEYVIRYLKEELDLGFLYEREQLYNRVKRLMKPHSPVAKDYFSTIVQRLFKGGRMDA